jgi:hypothetical protein
MMGPRARRYPGARPGGRCLGGAGLLPARFREARAGRVFKKSARFAFGLLGPGEVFADEASPVGRNCPRPFTKRKRRRNIMARSRIANRKPKKTRTSKKSRKGKSGGGRGSKSNAWRQYVGSNEPIPD